MITRVEQSRYPRSVNPQEIHCRPTGLRVAGREVGLSPNSYVRLACPGETGRPQTHLIGDDHDRALYFLDLAAGEGIVTGKDELFVHIDSQRHPDNARIERAIVNCANYVTRVAELFPKMERWFLHPGLLNASGRSMTWGGPAFSLTASLHDPRLPAMLSGHPRVIVSSDLDLFEDIQSASLASGGGGNFLGEEPRLSDVLTGFLRKCCLGMLFTSPGYTNEDQAARRIERLLAFAA